MVVFGSFALMAFLTVIGVLTDETVESNFFYDFLADVTLVCLHSLFKIDGGGEEQDKIRLDQKLNVNSFVRFRPFVLTRLAVRSIGFFDVFG